MNWKLIGAVVVALLAVIAYGLYGTFTGGDEGDTPFELTVVRRGTLEVTVSATGSVAPQAELALAFATGGQVAEVLVDEGDQVVAGDALARQVTCQWPGPA